MNKIDQTVVEAEVVTFFKDFIKSRNYRKLVSVESVLDTPGIINQSYVVSLKGLISFLRNASTQKFTINTLSKYKNKKGEYLINQEFTLFKVQVVHFYDQWVRDKQLQEILD